MARPFRYHIYDSDKFDSEADGDGAIELQVPINAHDPKGMKEPKKFYGLKRELKKLRDQASGKGICDASVDKVGVSLQSRDLCAIKLGKGSDHKTLICGCHHSREWIALEMAYYLAEYLVEHFSDSPSTDNDKRIKHLLSNREIWIVPLVNPDGHNVTITENRFWRPNVREIGPFSNDQTFHVEKRHPRDITIPANKTFKGVDLNRNYATKTWGEETYQKGDTQFKFPATSRDPKDSGPGSVFCGLTPGSEPESQAMTSLMQAQKFKALLTFHSFGQDYVIPNSVEGDPFLDDHRKGLEQLVNQNKNPYHFKLSKDYAYETTGDMMDMFLEISTGKPAYTPEVRPSDPVPESGEFSGLPESQIEGCFKENLAAMLATINGAAFTAKADKVTVKASESAATVQVVTNYWKAFVDWQP
jgi:carboxypeptidase T